MRIIIFGIGDLAKQLYYYLSESKENNIEYFCVTREYYKEDYFMGKKVLCFEDIENELNKEYQFLIAVGYKNMRLRKEVFNLIKSKEFSLFNFIHHSSVIMGEVIGEGNIILPNVTIEPYSKIMDNNIIWSNSVICHDTLVGNHNFIAASSIIGGFTQVIENNFIGFNSVLKDNINVGREVLIGASSLVTKSPEDYSVYYGSPAVKIKDHEKDGIHI